ncbi:MAG: WYL domain-containing protein [Lachnospiraceae bacterium]|nr:WYL domain-containing protein [Lachnospiraceae bacterium]
MEKKEKGPKAYNLKIISVLKAKSSKESPITVKTIQNELNKIFYDEKVPDLKTIRSQLSDIISVISEKISLRFPSNPYFYGTYDTMPQLGFTIECCIKDSKGNYIPYKETDSDDCEDYISGEIGSEYKKIKRLTTKYYYYQHLLNERDLSLLIEDLETNNSIRSLELQSLIRRIASLSPVYMRNYLTKRYNTNNTNVEYFVLSENLKKLKEAISERKLVSIVKCYYNTDHVLTEENIDEPYLVLPVKTINVKGYCYMEAISYDQEADKSTIKYFRLDQMCIKGDVQKPNTLQKFQYRFPKDKSTLDVSEYRFPYLFMGRNETQRIKMQVSNTHEMLNVLYDFFGGNTDIREEDASSTWLSVSVTAPIDGIKAFAKEYCTEVKILSPKTLAYEVKEDLKKALELYENN